MLSFSQILYEKLTLAYHRTLNQKLFEGDTIREDVRQKLLEIGYAWVKYAKIPENRVLDIIMTGGNCQFNYTKYSDIDVHIVINKKLVFGKFPHVEEYLDDKKTLWSLSRKIKVKGYQVELFAQNQDSNLVASGVFSLLKNKWIKKPVHGHYNFKEDDALQKKVDEISNQVDNMISHQMSEIDFKTMKEKLKVMRNAALTSGNEFSFENLVFKELRNRGVLKKMNDYVSNLRDRSLSLESEDLCVGERVSKSDARKLQDWWNRKGATYLKANQFSRKGKHREFSVFLQKDKKETK